MASQYISSAPLPQGFSVYQPALGAQLQFFPELGSVELDDMINAYLPGFASIKEKRATISLDFLEHAQLTGQTFKFYPIFTSNSVAPSPVPSVSSSFNVSPVNSTWDFSQISSPSASSQSSKQSRRRSKATGLSARQPTTDFSHLPGMKIMTKEGLDVTNSASRGSKTKEQRDHAHLMRIIKACSECRRKKVRCDPSHKKRTQTQSPPTSKPAKKSRTSSQQPTAAATPAVVESLSISLSPIDLDLSLSFADLENFDFSVPTAEPWEEFVQYPSTNDENYDFFLDSEGYFSSLSTASSTTSPLKPLSPSSQPEEALSVPEAQQLDQQTIQQPFLLPRGSLNDYADFNLYSPDSSFSEDERMIPIARSRLPKSSQQQPLESAQEVSHIYGDHSLVLHESGFDDVGQTLVPPNVQISPHGALSWIDPGLQPVSPSSSRLNIGGFAAAGLGTVIVKENCIKHELSEQPALVNHKRRSSGEDESAERCSSRNTRVAIPLTESALAVHDGLVQRHRQTSAQVSNQAQPEIQVGTPHFFAPELCYHDFETNTTVPAGSLAARDVYDNTISIRARLACNALQLQSTPPATYDEGSPEWNFIQICDELIRKFRREESAGQASLPELIHLDNAPAVGVTSAVSQDDQPTSQLPSTHSLAQRLKVLAGYAEQLESKDTTGQQSISIGVDERIDLMALQLHSSLEVVFALMGPGCSVLAQVGQPTILNVLLMAQIYALLTMLIVGSFLFCENLSEGVLTSLAMQCVIMAVIPVTICSTIVTIAECMMQQMAPCFSPNCSMLYQYSLIPQALSILAFIPPSLLFVGKLLSAISWPLWTTTYTTIALASFVSGGFKHLSGRLSAFKKSLAVAPSKAHQRIISFWEHGISKLHNDVAPLSSSHGNTSIIRPIACFRMR